MATESVKILIEAEDKATAALQKTAREAEIAAAKFERVKQEQLQTLEYERILLQQGAEAADAYKLSLQGLDTQTAALIAKEKALITEQKKLNADMAKTPDGFKSTKASTEFFGAIANLAGGNQIGAMAGQLAGLTEKTAQFNEIAKQGGAAATAFKVGIAGAVAALSYQAGSSVGNLLFQTEAVNAEFEKSIALLRGLNAESLKLRDISFADFTASLSLASDPDASIQERLEETVRELTQKQESIKAAEAKLAESQQNQFSFGEFATNGADNFRQVVSVSRFLNSGDEKANIQGEQARIESLKQEAAQYDDQREKLERLLGVEKERAELALQRQAEQSANSFLDDLRGQVEMLNAQLDGTADELKAMRGAGAIFESGEATNLLKQIAEKEKQLADVQKEKEKATAVNDLRQRELDKLEEERILLEKGKEALHAFRLEKQGLSSDEAARIASTQAELDKIEQERNVKAKESKIQPLQAQESRLLTRGPEQDKTAENTKKIADLSKEQLVKLENIYKRLEPKEKTGTTLELVSK